MTSRPCCFTSSYSVSVYGSYCDFLTFVIMLFVVNCCVKYLKVLLYAWALVCIELQSILSLSTDRLVKKKIVDDWMECFVLLALCGMNYSLTCRVIVRGSSSTVKRFRWRVRCDILSSTSCCGPGRAQNLSISSQRLFGRQVVVRCARQETVNNRYGLNRKQVWLCIRVYLCVSG